MLLWLLLCAVLAQQHGHDSGTDNIHAGVVLDLAGRSPEARKYFAQAIKAAKTPAEKVQAQRAMAASYAFTADCRGAENFDRAAYDFFIESGDFYNAGEVADELGRICLDSGDIDTAYERYRKGHDAGLEPENLPVARKDLWNYRWAHARARIAARRGKREEAERYVSAAKAILEMGTNPDQEIYFPYLTGYVAFYTGDYSGALANLRNANQTDPFIQCLIAQCYEKLGLGDSGNARTWYGKAASTTAHSVPAAIARPLSVLKLQQIN
jgi:tetratricopeptide (TPR) repeat protein